MVVQDQVDNGRSGSGRGSLVDPTPTIMRVESSEEEMWIWKSEGCKWDADVDLRFAYPVTSSGPYPRTVGREELLNR